VKFQMKSKQHPEKESTGLYSVLADGDVIWEAEGSMGREIMHKIITVLELGCIRKGRFPHLRRFYERAEKYLLAYHKSGLEPHLPDIVVERLLENRDG